MNQVLLTTSTYRPKIRRSSGCTCEVNEIKTITKNKFRYSMCDICSEKRFSKNEIHIMNHQNY